MIPLLQLELALDTARPVGARGRFRIVQDPYANHVVLCCQWCGVAELLGYEAAHLGKSDYVNLLRALVNKHTHMPPQPLTAEERERGRILRKHRRGAWKLH